ncbi:MAG TPA: hypothetical protein VND80_05340 [Steroidobacteraceae bacterium]|nr:hypothetical protein [Steroidobacteraceae bacterium]
MHKVAAGLLMAALAGTAPRARAASAPVMAPSSAAVPARASITVVTTADVVRTRVVAGTSQTRLVPADRVVAGDPVVYTLTVRNEGLASANHVVVNSPIPRQMRYLPGTAVGPAAKVSFSVDGGRSYGEPAQLRVADADGALRAATAADYTDIRWVLQDTLQAGSVAFVRYTAVLR